MQPQTSVDPWWAALTVWAVVNAVNLLQAAGFLSRVRTGSMAINHSLTRKCHEPFLGGWGPAMAPGYPTMWRLTRHMNPYPLARITLKAR